MVNIYDSSKKTRKQRKRELKEKIFVETTLNKEDEFCNDTELKFKKNKQHNEYRTTLLKKYKVFLRESKLKGDLKFEETNPSISNYETINKNFKIIDDFHQMKNKKQEKHDKNGKTSHRSVIEMLQVIIYF